jgi:hypothetical protein
MKTLKFFDPLPELILKGVKIISWRVNDEKDIKAGDEVQLIRKNDLKEFAKAQITSVKETTFGKLSNEDKKGHEEFTSDEEMYATYSRYYGFPVKPETKLKVIRFKLIK